MKSTERRANAAAAKAWRLFVKPIQTLDEMSIVFGGFVKIVSRSHPNEIDGFLDELHSKALANSNLPSLKAQTDGGN